MSNITSIPLPYWVTEFYETTRCPESGVFHALPGGATMDKFPWALGDDFRLKVSEWRRLYMESNIDDRVGNDFLFGDTFLLK